MYAVWGANIFTVKIPFTWKCYSSYDTDNLVSKITTMEVTVSGNSVITVTFDISSNIAAGNSGGSTISNLSGNTSSSTYNVATGEISTVFTYFGYNTYSSQADRTGYTYTNTAHIIVNNGEITGISFDGTYKMNFTCGYSMLSYNNNAYIE